MMSGLNPTSSEHRGDTLCSADNGNVETGDDALDQELLPDLIHHHPNLFSSSPLREKMYEVDSSWSQGVDQLRYGPLERKWLLWHEFMIEHTHLDAWLQLAEQAVTTLNLEQVTYSACKEELRRFERLRCEAGCQFIQLDSLTRRNRILTRLFQGTMQARLLASARECGQRWEDVDAKLETITRRLQSLVSEWEDFEAEREELALWLADMDTRLTEIDHMSGNNCEKLRRLQSFQHSVCENSGRVNNLLQRGEELLQRSESADAQHVESRLLELLRRCSHVYNNIARTHTRLLSMRLVFDNDCVLSQRTDSGSPSELIQEDGLLQKYDPDISSVPPHLNDFRQCVNCVPIRHSLPPSPSPPFPSYPAQELMGLEWDPSVDIGRSVSHDDADSSYFSASNGLCQREDTKRWSYLSSFDSRSDISTDITNQEAVLSPWEWTDQTDPGLFSPITTSQAEGQWTVLTTEGDANEPMGFNGGRVNAWLRVQSSSTADNPSSGLQVVPTDADKKFCEGADAFNQLHLHPNSQHCHDNTQHPLPVPLKPSCDLEGKALADHMKQPQRLALQDEDEFSCCEEAELLLSKQSHTDSRPSSSSSSSSSALLYLLLATAVALLASLIWVTMEPPCHRSNRMPRSLHLTLRYINGPPPT
ncbi:uncharacterized protein si:ch211-137a8.2 isoform X1 [Cyprinodon tularosa]|uniref:uncharacterized protein si:ch211-137a8.2 isoform X1 n=1 Tax=Cyprinodon tularosa TaxID=77115 RepID=UPI0018E2136F|nr:uncharacterized protein si:ch211-137a8.2 isoform X1 [Cyprinodon tularosa]